MLWTNFVNAFEFASRLLNHFTLGKTSWWRGNLIIRQGSLILFLVI
jgi:hypothetical protein